MGGHGLAYLEYLWKLSCKDGGREFPRVLIYKKEGRSLFQRLLKLGMKAVERRACLFLFISYDKANSIMLYN